MSGFLGNASALTIGILVFAAIVMIALATFGWAEDRLEARRTMNMLQDYDADVVKKLRKVRERETVPLTQQISQLGNKLTSAAQLQSTRTKLALAGRPTKVDLDNYLASKVICLVLGITWFVAIMFLVPIFHGKMQIIAAVFGAAVGFFYPDIRVSRLKEARQNAIRKGLADTLDILCISVEAGLGFEQALDQVVTTIPGPLSDEFFRMLGEVRAGAQRADALMAIDERTQIPELKAFILAVTQADRFGVSIGQVLRSQANEMRIKRRQLIQEKAQKLPVKMLLPMVFCIFPALMVVLLGPAMISFIDNF